MEKGKRLFLIDGNAYCYRAYYGVKDLRNSQGQPTNAVYGFIKILDMLIKKEKPDYLAITFDLKAPTFRHQKYEQYKAQRKPMPLELVSQIPLIKEVVRAYNIPLFEKEGFEADDILATISEKAVKEQMLVYIVTGDKDILQLVSAKIKVYNTHKEGLIYDSEKVKEKYGVAPEKIIEVLCLMGDSSDNIPGVPGIGEKTATELIKKFGTLEKVLANIDQIKREATKNALREFAEQARMARELVILDKNVPLEIDFNKLRLKSPDKKKLNEIFTKLEFKSLILNKNNNYPQRTIQKIDSLSEKQISQLKDSPQFVFNIKLKEDFGIENISFILKGREVTLSAENIQQLTPVFEDKKLKKLGHNLKPQIVALANCGIHLNGISFDTQIAAYLLTPEQSNYDLKTLAFIYLSQTFPGSSPIIILRLKEVLEKKLKEKNLFHLFANVEIPLIKILAAMEREGIGVDKDLLNEISANLKKKLRILSKDIYEIAGEEFNLNSPLQLRKILFDKLKLPIIKKTKTGASTSEEVLEQLSNQHSLPATILQYRHLFKLKSTYVDTLPSLINEKTGRIHTTFNQTVTATGRLSSSNPNLQNIPIKSEIGREIRKVFVSEGLPAPARPAGGGRQGLFLSADYSQIELRILAHLCGDKNLIEAFKKDLDIHNYTAGLIFDLPVQKIDTEKRRIAKTVNFGIIYGMGAHRLSQDLKISHKQAEEFIDAYFERYPAVKVYIEKQIKGAKENGYVTTMLGRRRYVHQINSEEHNVRGFGERIAINMPVQGSAADLIKMAMIDVCQEVEKQGLKTKLILQVHDELLFEVPKEELLVKKIIKERMENVLQLKVPLKVDIKVGRSWGEMS